MAELFRAEQADVVVHLAAEGRRAVFAAENPAAYVDSNLVGFVNVLEGCRHSGIQHFVYASSSSVYGANKKLPFAVDDPVDHPLSLYAATKKANELMAHSYSHLYSIPTTGLRFFTVYGPWGRPDMAMWLFAEAILNDRPINVFNQGKMRRDFTYIDDIVEGVVRVADRIPQPGTLKPGQELGPGTSLAPFRIYNIGNNEPIELCHLIELVEKIVGKPAQKNFLPMQPGDVLETYADVDDLMRDVGFRPGTPIEVGIAGSSSGTASTTTCRPERMPRTRAAKPPNEPPALRRRSRVLTTRRSKPRRKGGGSLELRDAASAQSS